jgi:hypothetical protein
MLLVLEVFIYYLKIALFVILKFIVVVNIHKFQGN